MPTTRITLIEDDRFQQIVLKDMLRDRYDVSVYATYEDALRYLSSAQETNAPDLILCDMILPDGDGIGLRQHLHHHAVLRDCPFIFLTGSENSSIKRDAIALGIDGYLQKPIEREILIDTLERTLARSRQLHHAMHARLNHHLNEPLRPWVPEHIGPYRLHLAHREIVSGGGDFVFHLKVGDTDFILLGDVMGHGAPAKFFLHAYAGYLYGLVRSFRHYHFAPNAGDLLHLLNREMVQDAFLQRWLLTCIALSFSKDGRIILALAGHPFAWLLDNTQAKNIGTHGIIPGLLPAADYANNEIPLLSNQRLLITTDGAEFDPLYYDPSQSTSALLRDLTTSPSMPDDATALIIERL